MAVAQGVATALAIGIPLALEFASTISADAGYLLALNLASRDSIATIELKGGGSPDTYRRLQDRATQAVVANTSDRMTPISESATTSTFKPLTLNGSEFRLEGELPLNASFYPALEQKARLTSGAWPAAASADPVQATVSEATAQFYAWKAGDVVCLASVDDTAPRLAQSCVRITGIWRPSVASDPYWLAGPSIRSITLAPDGFWSFAQRTQRVRTTTSSVYRPDPARLTVADAPALETGLKRLRSSLRYGGDDLLTSLDQTIAAFLDRAAVNRFPVQLVGAELILVVLFGFAFLTQSFVASQTAPCTLRRIRGWSRSDVARFLNAQLLLLAVPAVVLGTAAALVATWWQAGSYGLDSRVVITDVTSDLGAALVLTALAIAAVSLALTLRFSWRSVSEMRRAVSAQAATPWWRVRNVDIWLAVIALPLLAEAALRGQAAVRTQQEGPDLIGLALPIVALTFLAIAALRLTPLLVQPIRLLGSRVSARLTWWRLSRRPAEHAGAAVLLSLTLAVGLFASIYEATETSNAADRAAYATGADLRIAFTPEAGPQGIRNELTQIGGVKANTSVLREHVQIASSSETVTALALDSVTFAGAAWSRPGLTTPSLGSALAQMSGTPSAIELPGQPTELRIWVEGLGQPATLEALVRDPAGQICSCSFGSLQFADWRQLRAQVTFPQAAHFPLRLELLRIHRTGAGNPGGVDVSALQSVSTTGVATIEDFATVRGWWARDQDGLIMAPGVNGPRHLGASTTAIAVPAAGDITLYPPFRGSGLPFLMAAPTMSRLALRPGDSVALSVQSHQVLGRLIGPVDYVPTLYPGSEDFIVLPLDRTISAFAAALSDSQTPNEMWFALSPQAERAAQSLGPGSNVNFAVYRQHEQDVAAGDPVLIQLRANLATALAASLLLAFLGFAVHFLIAARSRLAEHAILEANGLDPSDVRRGIAIEQVLIGVFALLVGAALAAVAAAVLVPSLQFGAMPTAVVPPTVVRVDWPSLLAAVIAAAAIAALIAWFTRRFAASVDVVEEIRKLG